MARRNTTIERYSVQQHCYTIIEAATAQARCQGRMTTEAFEAKLAEMFDLYVYPDPDQRLDFWLAAEAEMAVEPAPEPEPELTVTVYDLAQDAVTSRRASFPAEAVHLCRSGKLTISLARFKDEVYMTASSNGNAEKTRVAWLSPLAGWSFCLSTWDYKAWVERCEAIG